MKYECKYCLCNWLGAEHTICKCPKCNKVIIPQISVFKHIHEILRDIVVVLGIEVLYDKVRVCGLLADLRVNKKIRKLVLFAIEENIHGKLLSNKIDYIKIESVKYFFSIQNFLYKEIADYIVDSFAYAIGIVNSIDISKVKNDWLADNFDIRSLSMYEIIKPVIISKFCLIDDNVIEGHSFFIEYQTQNANRVYINNEAVSVNSGKYNAKISGYKKFIMIAENEHYRDSRELEVWPIKNPNIIDFKINNLYIKSGDEVILSWSVENAYRIILKYDNKVIDVTNICELRVVQEKTTQYILLAYAIDDVLSVSLMKEVFVVKYIKIQYFKTSKKRIFESDKILLSWDVTNATKILLMPIQKDVTTLRQIEVYPINSGIYCLQASNELFEEESRIFISVSKLPVIENISFPELPDLNVKLPDLNVDMHFGLSIFNQIKNAGWYNSILSLQFREMYIIIDKVMKKLKNIL